MIVTVRRLGRPTLLVKAVDGILGTSRRTIAVMDLAAGTHVLVMGAGPETQLGHAALHRLLIPFPGHLERLPGAQRAFAPGAAGNTAPLG